MPTAPSASWVAECAACHHSNPARAHFCSVCGAPLHSPAAAAAKAAAEAAAMPDTATGEGPEPRGFMLHFNDDNTLAIAPRYTSRDSGDAGDGPAATAHAVGPATAPTPHAEFRFSLPGPQPRDAPPAAPPAARGGWPSATVAGAMLVLTALVGTGSYLLGRSSVTAPAASGVEAAQLAVRPAVATAAALGTVSGTGMPQLATAPAAATPPGDRSLDQAQQALALADAATGRSAVAPMAPAVPSRPVVPTVSATKAPAAAIAPAAAAAHAPAATPCNATVAALGLCEP